MKYLMLAAVIFVACGKRHSAEHQMAFDRAMRETRLALKYPDASELPTIDKARITESGDTVSVMFTVMASNAFGVKSSEMTLLDFRVDSCAHLLGGMLPGNDRARPDFPGRPCDIVEAIEWEYQHEEEHRRYWDSVDTHRYTE
jgi:hypothetical protein